jgi:SAM-dependent methyltransferase
MQDTTVSAADIARLADVGRTAVSNWRRRHPDFPQPVGGTSASPLFGLADVEAWLRTQGKLVQMPLAERAWQELRTQAGDDLQLAAVLAEAGDVMAGGQAVAGTSVRVPVAAGSVVAGSVVAGSVVEGTVVEGTVTGGRAAGTAVAELVTALGAADAFEVLLRRFQEMQARRIGVTSPEVAELMAGLAGEARTVLDPACGTGELLLAARAGGVARQLLGQDIAAGSARLAGIRLRLDGADATVRIGDSLRADAFAGVVVDAVLCDPPFHDRGWEPGSLTADPRWAYGLPPRLEPELAWAQHSLAHLAPGGLAVVVVPAAAAGRRPGRRIRAQLLRRGALRGVIALSSTHHLWLLRRPDGETPGTVLMVAASDPQTAIAAWERYRSGPAHDDPGVSRAVPIIDLLDEEVNLTPARHLSARAPEQAAERFTQQRHRLVAEAGEIGGLIPDLRPATDHGDVPAVPVAELARIGHLVIHHAPARGDTGNGDEAVLTVEDVIDGRPASATGASGERWFPLRAGDIVVAAVAGRLAVRVLDADGGLLGPGLVLVRTDPEQLDPYFVAGTLRSSANAQTSVIQTGGGSRADIGRALVPRLPLAQQREYGEAFRRVDRLQALVRSLTAGGEELAQLLADGVTGGKLDPPAGQP